MQFRTPEAPATRKQTWYLFTLTERDYRTENLTMAEASTLIEQALKALSANETPSAQPPKARVPRAKAISKITKPVKTLAPKPTTNGFKCWYCLDGHEHQDIVINERQFYTLCQCNATTVDGPNYKLKRNKRGGVAGIVFNNGKGRIVISPEKLVPLPEKYCSTFKPRYFAEWEYELQIDWLADIPAEMRY